MMKKLSTLLACMIWVFVVEAQYNYLGTYDAEGVPDYLVERDTVSQNLLDHIGFSLPERYPVPEYNPHLISAGYDTEITVLEEAEVWVTFVEEGAGFRNVLGFYSYDMNEPLTEKPADSEITIIFPNVSKEGSGGGLAAGDKVKIGTFPPNTGIGWVLFADGWRNGGVTSGNWSLFSNPDFNPESEESERYHNVLLEDPETGKVVLGFEDIRRDNSGCDHDFNDALFYITASPNEAVSKGNFASLATSSSVASSNNGGLESNGDLATAIAKRNHRRAIGHTAHDTRDTQVNIAHRSAQRVTNPYEHLIPPTGLFQGEEARVATPDDLLDLTNATHVFSLDYYKENDRLAAVLLTKTEGEVYNHSKNICDRLNGGSVEDLRYVKLSGLHLLYAEVITEDGKREFSCWFSVKESAAYYELFSFWNIEAYPEGDYLNFQVWGQSPAQVFHKIQYIQRALSKERFLLAGHQPILPQVFVKSGYYAHGSLWLRVANNAASKSLVITADMRRAENRSFESARYEIALNGSREEIVKVPTGALFDVGMSVSASGSGQMDNLYMADGAWGVDHDENKGTVSQFEVSAEHRVFFGDAIRAIERGFEVSGETQEVVNVFRNLQAGNTYLDIEGYSIMNLQLMNTTPVELVLIPKDLEDWAKRPRVEVPAADGYRQLSIDLKDFGVDLKEVKSLIIGCVSSSGENMPFQFGARNIQFANEIALANAPLEQVTDIAIYPNPIEDKSMLEIVSQRSQTYQMSIYSMDGRLVYHDVGSLKAGRNEVEFEKGTIKAGFYNLRVIRQDGKKSSIKIIVR